MIVRSSQIPRLTGLLALSLGVVLLAHPVDAQTPSGPSQPRRVSLGFDGLEQEVETIADELELDLLEGNEKVSTWLLKTAPGISEVQFSQVLVTLGTYNGTLYAEEDLRADIPDVAGCRADGGSTAGEVQPQQCTVGFVDGDPTDEKYASQSALKQISATSAHWLKRSYTPVVAVIDTGIDPGHKWLAGQLFSLGHDFVDEAPGGFERTDGIDDDGDGLLDEAYGHGTHIAGTIIAVDPKALILPIRAMDTDGGGFAFDIAQAIFYAVDEGADIINLSLSVSHPAQSLISALQYAEAADVVVFTSAGNTGGDVLFPGNYDASEHAVILPAIAGAVLDGREILTVAAVDASDIKADFSAWGPDVDICAPGVAVYSTFPGDQFAWYSGTSMATAIASGVAALTLGIGGPGPIKSGELLRQSADPVDSLNAPFEGGLGAGRLDALAAGLDALKLKP